MPAKQPLLVDFARRVVRRIRRSRPAPPGPFDPVTSAALDCLAFRPPGKRAALFVTHCPDGVLKPHVEAYARSLRAEGIGVYLIIAADRGYTRSEEWPSECCDGLWVRENTGYDFAAWAHILKKYKPLWDVEILYLINDSVIGPTNQYQFGRVLRMVDAHRGALVGLTESHERRWHIQSYFLALKSELLRNPTFSTFVDGVVSFHDKESVINAYEVRLASIVKDAGIAVGSVFGSYDRQNPTLFHWRRLLDDGFPFLKVTVPRGVFEEVDAEGWREALAQRGYDATPIESLFKDASPR